ncbi:hypothetical protein SRO_2756 [Streptomyces rochei]|nr:hypothetical protein SRO_2756 [Streptomyces rochei]
MSAAAVGSASLFCATLPEATPTTLPTAVTAVAEATANPRTEIRLTRFPSSIARFGDPGGRNRAPEHWPPNCGVTGGTGPVGNSPCGKRRVVRGRHTTNAMELVLFLMFRTSPTALKVWEVPPGGAAGSYAGPDRTETLP